MKIYFIIISLFTTHFVFSQTTAERYTVSSGGGEAFDGIGNSYMYNIGGVVVNTTITSGNISLTQGFEQSNYGLSDVLIFNPPNAFSPDGDGVNDTWMLPLPPALINTIDLVIFNRWGDEVARIENYNNMDNVWNGTYQNSGEPVTNGTYFYIAETTENNKKFSGWVQVVR